MIWNNAYLYDIEEKEIIRVIYVWMSIKINMNKDGKVVSLAPSTKKEWKWRKLWTGFVAFSCNR